MSERDARLLNAAERRAFQDGLRHKRTRQGRFDARCLHFGHPLPGGGRMLEASDGGAGAAAIYETVEVKPLWQKLWRNAAAKLPRTGKAVLAALLVDWRSRPAGKMAKVDHKTVDAWKTKFKTHFSQCFQAYKQDFTN